MPTKKKKVAKGGQSKPTAPDTPAFEVGRLLANALRTELCNIKNPANAKQNVWGTLSEVQQEEILERYQKVTADAVARGFDQALSNGLPAVYATLSAVKFTSKGINGSLEISKDSEHRHALSDASGRDVLVVLAPDLDEYLDSMKSVKPDRDQRDLPLDTKPVEEDPHTLDELRDAAASAAKAIGEPEVAAMVPEWGAERLRDYLTFAESKKAAAAARKKVTDASSQPKVH